MRLDEDMQLIQQLQISGTPCIPLYNTSVKCCSPNHVRSKRDLTADCQPKLEVVLCLNGKGRSDALRLIDEITLWNTRFLCGVRHLERQC